MHWLLSHIPYWAVKVFALVGGIGTLINWVEKLSMQILDKAQTRYDEPVWAILRDRQKFKVTGTSGDKPMYDRDTDAPFQPVELASELGRREWLVKGSLKRLEKRGKIKEVRGGWVRKDKA